MQISENWLREWVNPEIDRSTLCEQLTMAGLEVDGIEPVVKASLAGVVTGRIDVISAHPDAKKLNVCQVNIGTDVPLTIVCGAANARQGLVVAVATIGTKLPGGMEIKPVTLRGVDSFGMLCAASELSLEESSDGLMELADSTPLGMSLEEFLGLDDYIIDMDLTPNRGDCLSVVGVARELGVLNRLDVAAPKIVPVKATTDLVFPAKNSDAEACPVYLGRVVSGINLTAQTPVWMTEKLRRSDIRPISPVVDVTNFVMLELGQPMHAFDLDKLSGGVTVRRSSEQESIELLGGNKVELAVNTLLIADDSQPLAIAGVMGGEGSCVDSGTTRLFLEAAHFNPIALAGKARSYGLHTDSSHRFERGVDPELPARAMERATGLILDICGGEAGPVVTATSEAEKVAKQPPILLRKQRINDLVGVTFSATDVTEILSRLGMALEVRDSAWLVTPPSYRFDIENEVDLIEELARIYGYQNIAAVPLVATATLSPVPEKVTVTDRLKDLLVDRGFQETINYSFIDREQQQIIDPAIEPIALINPIASDMSVMRTSMIPGLLRTYVSNANRQQERIRLFEVGNCFRKIESAGSTEVENSERIALLLSGNRLPENWSDKSQPVDFFDIKAEVENLNHLAGTAEKFTWNSSRSDALHPGRSADLFVAGKQVGSVGELHPSVAKKMGIKKTVLIAELTLDALKNNRVPSFSEISKFPVTRRDLAIVVEKNVTAEQIRQCVLNHAPELIKEVILFDLYTGEGIESSQKSVALRLIIQAFSETLTDERITSTVNGVIAALNRELAATLRD